MSDLELHQRVTTLEVKVGHHTEALDRGERMMFQLHKALEEQSRIIQDTVVITNSNSKQIAQLAKDTSEIVSIHKTAKNVRKFLIYWLAPLIVGLVYLKDNIKDWFS